MKKLLFIMLVGIGGTMLIKNGYVTIAPDNEVRVAGHPLPLPDALKNSPIMGMVTTMLMGQLPAAPQAAGAPQMAGAPQLAGAAPRPGAPPARPALPSVTSVAGTYNANAP